MRFKSTIKKTLIHFATLNLLLVFYTVQAQSIDAFKNRIRNVVRMIPDNIHSQEECNSMIRSLKDISDDIDEVLEQEGQSTNTELSNLKKQSVALESFIACVGNSYSGSGQLSTSDFAIVRNLINVSLSEVYAGKYCANIYELNISSYKCLLVMKKSANKDIWKIDVQLSSGNATSSISSGLESNHYRRIWGGGETRSTKPFKVLKLSCTFTGNYKF